MKTITETLIQDFKYYLVNEERTMHTVKKYTHDIKLLADWLKDGELNKNALLAFKKELTRVYAISSTNSILAAVNCFLEFVKMKELKTKTIKIQRQIFASKEKELTKKEYEKLLAAAKVKSNKRLYNLMMTICSTGIRVSELQFITVQAVQSGRAVINCKNKTRIVIIPDKLCTVLKKFIKSLNITEGPVFITKTGKPLDRSNIWSDMKKLCKDAGVPESKVFPHNLRHLFARTYYSMQKDIVRLADILGHSSVNTTRIYTMETGDVHRKQLQKLAMLLC